MLVAPSSIKPLTEGTGLPQLLSNLCSMCTAARGADVDVGAGNWFVMLFLALAPKTHHSLVFEETCLKVINALDQDLVLLSNILNSMCSAGVGQVVAMATVILAIKFARSHRPVFIGEVRSVHIVGGGKNVKPPMIRGLQNIQNPTRFWSRHL